MRWRLSKWWTLASTGAQASLCWRHLCRQGPLSTYCAGTYALIALLTARSTRMHHLMKSLPSASVPLPALALREVWLTCQAVVRPDMLLIASTPCLMLLLCVQMRGSIPLYWVQDTASVSPINPKPAIQLQQYDPHYSATRLHFQVGLCM